MQPGQVTYGKGDTCLVMPILKDVNVLPPRRVRRSYLPRFPLTIVLLLLLDLLASMALASSASLDHIQPVKPSLGSASPYPTHTGGPTRTPTHLPTPTPT